MACLIYLGDSELGEVLAAINQIGDIYWLIAGCSQEGKGHHPIKSSKAPAVLHLSSVNSLQSIHLDNSGRSKKFSYNLQPSSQSKNKPKL